MVDEDKVIQVDMEGKRLLGLKIFFEKDRTRVRRKISLQRLLGEQLQHHLLLRKDQVQ
jgi:hypothetical protein